MFNIVNLVLFTVKLKCFEKIVNFPSKLGPDPERVRNEVKRMLEIRIRDDLKSWILSRNNRFGSATLF